jgi:hypothetical protein
MRCCALLSKNQFVLCVFLRYGFLRGAENIGGGGFNLTHLLLQVRANLLFACALTKHYRCRSVFCSAHFLND